MQLLAQSQIFRYLYSQDTDFSLKIGLKNVEKFPDFTKSELIDSKDQEYIPIGQEHKVPKAQIEKEKKMNNVEAAIVIIIAIILIIVFLLSLLY